MGAVGGTIAILAAYAALIWLGYCIGYSRGEQSERTKRFT